MFGRKKSDSRDSSHEYAFLSQLGSMKPDEMAWLESSCWAAVHVALTEALPEDATPNSVVVAFLAALGSTMRPRAPTDDRPRPTLRVFRAEFARNAPMFASREGFAELAGGRMMPAVEDQFRTNPDVDSRAIACTAWLLLSVASGDGTKFSTLQLYAGALEAVSMAAGSAYREKHLEMARSNWGWL